MGSERATRSASAARFDGIGADIPTHDVSKSDVIDPLTLGVLWNRFVAIVEEQSARIIRAGMTTHLSQGGDVACSLFDSRGRLVSQSVGTPGVNHSLPTALRGFLEVFPRDSLSPGDALVTNDPWLNAGHLNDITIATPLFLDGRLAGFGATSAHAADIGGHGFSAEAYDLFDEGLQIPRLKLFKAGAPNDDLFAIIRQNVRVPEQVIGDILTQVGTASIVADAVQETLREFGLDNLDPVADAIIQASGKVMREAIAALPDGTYSDEVWADGLGEPIRFAVSLTIAGPNMTLDFTGTSAQVNRGINCEEQYSRAYAVYAVKSALCPDVPANDGVFEPVRTIVPQGTILNARRPAPVSARHLTGHFAAFVVFGALRQVVPTRVIADSAGPCGGALQLSGTSSRGEFFTVLTFYAGGLGARPTKDGSEVVFFPANSISTPVEILEKVVPIQVEAKEFIQDGGGPGRFRGGCGQRIVFRITSSQPVRCTFMFERTRYPARGFEGGLAGVVSRCEVNGHPIPNPKDSYLLQPGDLVSMDLAGGGGFYPPSERDVHAVLVDVLEEKVSVQAAREIYLVAVDMAARRVDEQGTAMLRAKAKATA